MKIFTYKDYMNYQKLLKEKEANSTNKNVYSQLQEEKEEYNVKEHHLENKTINNEHDKIFRKILDDKKEASNFINKALKLKYKIKPEEIEKYNSSFVTLELKNQESDIIYKLKTKNIFFLIEHQTKIDYTMPLRILEYENVIIRSAIDNSKIGQKGYKFPMVIPIVLYSGRKKWNVKNYIGEVQEKLKGYEELEFSKYNIVDVNNFDEEELLKEESFLSKAMLIEKISYTSNLAIYLEQIVEEVNERRDIYTNEQKKLLTTIIDLVLRKKLENNEVEQLIKKLKGEDENMLAVLEMIEEENKRLLARGEKRGIKKGTKDTIQTVTKRMIEEGADIAFIAKVTGLTETEIMKMNSKQSETRKKKA